MKRFDRDQVRGWLHEPSGTIRAAVALTHGAGSSAEAPFLVAAAEALTEGGFAVLRFDMPFRLARVSGGGALNAAQQARDREGIQRAASELRKMFRRVPVVLAGHSYGGRQSSMVAAEEPLTADALLLLSYPLHPPRQPEKLRTEHFPKIKARAVFVHGTRDPFGTIEELQSAIARIPSRTELHQIDKGPHNLPMQAAALLPEWLSAIME